MIVQVLLFLNFNLVLEQVWILVLTSSLLIHREASSLLIKLQIKDSLFVITQLFLIFIYISTLSVV